MVAGRPVFLWAPFGAPVCLHSPGWYGEFQPLVDWREWYRRFELGRVVQLELSM